MVSRLKCVSSIAAAVGFALIAYKPLDAQVQSAITRPDSTPMNDV
jgi:hypothetical protein